MALIIVFVRVQPIIVSLSGYLSLVGINIIIMPRPTGLVPDWMLSWGEGTTDEMCFGGATFVDFN